MRKNLAGQKWRVFAFNRSTGVPVTGDALNITSKISIDFGSRTAITDTNPTEAEDGYYYFDLTQAETNGDTLEVFPESVTSGVQVIGCPGHWSTTQLVNVLPFSYESEDRVVGQQINILFMEEIPIVIYVDDASGTLDLTTKTLKFIIENTNKNDVLVILNADIDRTANTITITVTQAVSAFIDTYFWALRDITSDEVVVAYGKLDVNYVAR